MKQLSNADFALALRLLIHLASRNGNTLREREAARKAELLARKMQRKHE